MTPAGVVAMLATAALMLLAIVVLNLIWTRRDRADEERDRRR